MDDKEYRKSVEQYKNRILKALLPPAEYQYYMETGHIREGYDLNFEFNLNTPDPYQDLIDEHGARRVGPFAIIDGGEQPTSPRANGSEPEYR